MPMERSAEERRQFVLSQTRVAPVPGLRGISLHTADAAFDLWHDAADWLRRGEIALPFWAFPWAGGTGLARHLQTHPALVQGKRVTDVASGSGLVGIVAALCGAAQVDCLDIDAMAESAALLNATINGASVSTGTVDVTTLPPRTGVILAGDICYEAPMAASMLAWLRSCREMGAEVYLGDPGRHYLDRQEMTAVGSYRIPASRELEAGDEVTVTVYRLEDSMRGARLRNSIR